MAVKQDRKDMRGAPRADPQHQVGSRPPRHRVLITRVDLPVGAALAGLLSVRGLRVHGSTAQSAEPTKTIADPAPTAPDPGFISGLVRIAARRRIDILIPTTASEMVAIASARAAFGPTTQVMLSGPGPVTMAQDLRRTYWQLAARGVATPRCGVPSDFSGPSAALVAMGGLAVLRSRWGKAGGRLIERADQLDWPTLTDDVVLQQVVTGRQSLVLVYRPSGRSRSRRAVVTLEPASADGRNGVRMSPGPVDEDVERTAQAAVRALGLTGPASVVVRRAAGRVPTVLRVRAGYDENVNGAPPIMDALVDELGQIRVRHR